MSTNGPRRAVVTPDDHGPILAIASWYLMVVSILSVMMRVGIRYHSAQFPSIDDAFLLLALVRSPSLYSWKMRLSKTAY
jgi:hypothetical protein